MSARTRFEERAKGNSEMAYWPYSDHSSQSQRTQSSNAVNQSKLKVIILSWHKARENAWAENEWQLALALLLIGWKRARVFLSQSRRVDLPALKWKALYSTITQSEHATASSTRRKTGGKTSSWLAGTQTRVGTLQDCFGHVKMAADIGVDMPNSNS